MSVELLVHRDYRDISCTMGMISNGVKNLYTMERPWVPSDKTVAGTKGVSCIPIGRYRLIRHNSEQHPNVWALVNPSLEVYHWDEDVPRDRVGIARTLVLIHAANRAEELRGCIAPGLARVRVSARAWSVTDSRDSLNQIRSWIGNALDAWITIDEEKLKG